MRKDWTLAEQYYLGSRCRKTGKEQLIGGRKSRRASISEAKEGENFKKEKEGQWHPRQWRGQIIRVKLSQSLKRFCWIWQTGIISDLGQDNFRGGRGTPDCRGLEDHGLLFKEVTLKGEKLAHG